MTAHKNRHTALIGPCVDKVPIGRITDPRVFNSSQGSEELAVGLNPYYSQATTIWAGLYSVTASLLDPYGTTECAHYSFVPHHPTDRANVGPGHARAMYRIFVDAITR
jgi:hypothetical protein